MYISNICQRDVFGLEHMRQVFNWIFQNWTIFFSQLEFLNEIFTKYQHNINKYDCHVYLMELECNVSIPHATCCEGYNLFDPSDSQSVNLVFSGGRGCFVNANPESAQRKFVKLCRNEDILCTCAYLQEFMIHFSGSYAYLHILLKQFVSVIPLNRSTGFPASL